MNPGFVYFAECVGPKGPIGSIKIGRAMNVEKRLKQVLVGTPFDLVLIAKVPGGLVLEAAVHLHLSRHRYKGEYFIDCPSVREFSRASGENGFAFERLVDNGKYENELGTEPVRKFLTRHGVSIEDACRVIGCKPDNYRKALEKNSYQSARVVAAASLIAMEKGLFVQWPSDGL